MDSVGAFEAKTHLSALLERAFRGETIEITKNGRPIARLVPPDDSSPRVSPEAAVAGLRELRNSLSLGDGSVKELVDEGRKY